MSIAAQRSRRREQREQVRAQILDTAAEMLRTRPYRELTVDELMARTGLSRTIFYRHFDDLPGLVVRLLEESGSELLERERRLVELDLDLPELIELALADPIALFLEHGPLLRAVTEAASHDEQIEEGFRALLDRFEQLIASRLRALGGRHALRDPDEAARALNLMNFYYLLDVFGSLEPRVAPEVALQTLSGIWLGVVSSPARRVPA